MARQKQIPILVTERISTEVFNPTPLPTIHISSAPVRDTCLDVYGWWVTSAGTSAIPAERIPNFYLQTGNVNQQNAKYSWWIFPCNENAMYAVVIENSYEFEIEEYNADGEIEEFWYFSEKDLQQI